MKAVDLHVHSSKSDGSMSPTELVSHALQKGLSAIALTDHDTIDGIEEALCAAKGKPIEVIPGIELSSEYEGRDIHIVGLYLDYQSPYLKRRLKHFVDSREQRNREMCDKLTALGMPVIYEELLLAYPDCIITRAHYAKYLLQKGYTRSVKEAFDRYIGDHGPCFVPRKKITPMRAIEIIRKAGGFPVLAHPVLYGMGKKKLCQLVEQLKEMGLCGIEVLYSSYTPSDERDMRAIAEKYNLTASGGSDYHGSAKPGLALGTGYGHLFVPEEILTKIKERHAYLQKHPEIITVTKILFTDLDGTLLNDQKDISDYTRSVLNAWCNAGHKFTLCSGRDINSVTQVAEGLKLNTGNFYLIGYNGGQIYDYAAKKTLYRVTLSREQIAHMHDVAKSFHIHLHTYTDTHIVTPAEDAELHYYRKVIKTPFVVAEDLLSAMLPDGACKCLAITLQDKEGLEQFRLALLPWAEKEGITLVYSDWNYLEIFPSVSGKGAAVKKLCELLSLSTAFAVSAGDAENDISMIEAAGMGIAMCNGIDLLKNRATTITDFDNNHDGLAHALADLI